MQDREIVAAIVAGHPGGLAAAYDRYARPLHAFCAAMLGEPSDAADAVQGTFIIAAAKLGGLRDPDRLRPWLYAVARNECRRRLRERASASPLEDAGDLADDAPAVGASAEQGDLRGLVRAALGGLNPGEREIIELNLRHELDGDDLAAALGVPRNQAHALASRARAQFQISLGALLVARSGQQACPDLAAILDGWGGELTPLLRKRVNRHIEHCADCGQRKRRELSPAMLLSMLPVALLPPSVRDQLFRLVSGTSPAAAAHRGLVIGRAGPFGPDGFPERAGPQPGARRARARPGVLAGAAALILLALGGGAVLAFGLAHQGRPAPAALAAGVRTAAATPAAAVVTFTATGRPGRHARRARPAASPPAPAGGSPAAGPVPTARTSSPARPAASPSATASRPATPSPPASPGTLAAAPATVRLVPVSAGNSYQASFTLTAQGGPVTFSISGPAPAGTLSVSPSAGPLRAGQAVTVTVTAPYPGGPPAYDTTLTVNPGGLTVGILYPPSG